ncbi:MAG: FixH family protein [Planctomycetota bacterium]
MTQSLPCPNEQLSQLLWTAFILMFFCIQAVIWTIAIAVTSSDTSHAVVAGYDEQALSWDQVKHARKLSDDLGWQSRLTISDTSDIRGYRYFTIKIKDDSGKPVKNAAVELRAFHGAAAGVPQYLSFTDEGAGVYQAVIRINQFGAWRISGSATRSDQKFLIEETIKITQGQG